MLFWPCHGTYLPAGCFETRSWPSRHGDHMPPDCENPHLPTWSSSFLIPRWNSSNKSGISSDFTPIIKDHQSIFQAPSSRIYPPEDRSRMAVLVRSAAEAFQSEDADPGALRCATAQRHAAVMPQCQSLQKIWVIDNFTMWNPQTHDTHAHFWHEHPFSKRNLVVNGRSMIQLQWRTALASWALRTTGPWSSLGPKRSMNPCGTCRRRPVLGSDLQICSANLEVLYGLMMSCMFFGVLK